jgi:hypothetical protein
VTEGSRLEEVPEISRRQFLLGTGATLGGVGAAKAIHNTTLGYGQFGMGRNLHEQALTPVVTEHLTPSYDETFAGTRLRLVDGGVTAWNDETTHRLDFDAGTRGDARRLDSDLGLGGRLTELFADGAALSAGEYTFEFSQPEPFFERIAAAEPRPDAVAAIRRTRDRAVDTALIERFVDADPARTKAVIDGLVEGFREYGGYDVPRYLAGSIEDNILFGAVDLRKHFESEVTFEAILDGGGTGLFCWELVHRSIEALQAVGPWEQTVPVAACYVRDSRHKHAFTGLASAIREDGDLVFPMTFLDYTHSTMYDDFHLTGLTGEGLAAYTDRHRADEMFW